MDSVDERTNGTIGGFCKNTVIAEKQCDVNNSYCNEMSITCQCKPGYELKLDVEKQDDTVSLQLFEFFVKNLLSEWPKMKLVSDNDGV